MSSTDSDIEVTSPNPWQETFHPGVGDHLLHRTTTALAELALLLQHNPETWEPQRHVYKQLMRDVKEVSRQHYRRGQRKVMRLKTRIYF